MGPKGREHVQMLQVMFGTLDQSFHDLTGSCLFGLVQTMVIHNGSVPWRWITFMGFAGILTSFREFQTIPIHGFCITFGPKSSGVHLIVTGLVDGKMDGRHSTTPLGGQFSDRTNAVTIDQKPDNPWREDRPGDNVRLELEYRTGALRYVLQIDNVVHMTVRRHVLHRFCALWHGNRSLLRNHQELVENCNGNPKYRPSKQWIE
mmetsp:Transcript_26232/g.48942  ORF Transcript_26232/g.48942 Transcript_26232/m.48942 type:complete len:204 (-) Transcript_26232:1265-1876(-)